MNRKGINQNLDSNLKMTFRLLFIPIIVLLFSCKAKTDYSRNYSNSSAVAFKLIKQCVDTMININRAINSKNYVLDLSNSDSLINKQGVDSFLYIKSLTLPVTYDDSVMIFKDDNPENFYMKQSMIIKIRTISALSEKIVLVTASKIRSTSEIVDATIRLERYSEGYIIKDVQITNNKP